MNGFGPLAFEAIADAFRRRIAFAVAAAALLSLVFVESCTSCSAPVSVNGELRDLAELAGGAGFGAFLLLGLWGAALAGVLGADHLRSALDDGSAVLALARPISRDTFALARLAGVLGLCLAAGVLVLGASLVLFATRSGLAALPGLLAACAAALGCATIAALAMAASLALPRAATLLLVLGGVFSIAVANGLGLVGELGGWLGALDRLGPPLASSLALSLAPWLPESATLHGDLVRLLARLFAWAVGSALALVWAFRRVELRS